MITAFSAITALLIGLFNNSTAENVLRYPRPQRPIIEQTFATPNPQPRDQPDASRIKREVPAKRTNQIRIQMTLVSSSQKRTLQNASMK
jgi:hypothetical protein